MENYLFLDNYLFVMKSRLYEVKFEVSASESEIVEELGLQFDREYMDVDRYLESDSEKTLKIKALEDGELILYEILYDGDCFNIEGLQVTASDEAELYEENPVRSDLERTKRVYFWPGFEVKVDFDYIKQLKGRVFLEAHAKDKSVVLRAKDFLKEKGFVIKEITEPYDRFIS